MAKRIIRISENDLNRIVKNAINEAVKVMESDDIDNLADSLRTYHGEPVNAGDVVIVDNINDFMKYAPTVWKMLEDSYASVGGIKTYRGYKDFINKAHLMKLVLDKNGEIIACATYRKINDSLKLVAVGCAEGGSLGIQQIIQGDIIDFDLYYWAEVSGAIEHYFQKYNGYPIPNDFVAGILKTSENEITLCGDKVHYIRKIGQDRDPYKKMMYGFKDGSIMQSVVRDVEDYGDFMKYANTLKEDSGNDAVDGAIYIIENLYRAHEEDGFNELIPSWNDALVKSLGVLKAHAGESSEIRDYTEYGEYLLDDMQLLTLNKLER